MPMFSGQHLLIVVLAALLVSTCSNEQRFSANFDALTEPAPPTEFTDAQGNKMISPGGWPRCWLSSRLSTVQAAVVAGESTSGWSGEFLYPEGERKEFSGTLQNPATTGKCTLNWFGKDQDNTAEPWLNKISSDPSKAGIEQKYPTGYVAALTCTADPTPDCHCITAIPANPGPNTAFGIGLCVRKRPGNLPDRPGAGDEFQLFNYHQPDPSLPLEPADGRCHTAQANLEALYKNQLEHIFAQQADGDLEIDGRRCRLDIEPFSAPPEEGTWYGNEVRDWGVITCKSDACRCFGIFTKSGVTKDKRSRWFEYDTCVICGEKDGKAACSAAKLNR